MRGLGGESIRAGNLIGDGSPCSYRPRGAITSISALQIK